MPEPQPSGDSHDASTTDPDLSTSGPTAGVDYTPLQPSAIYYRPPTLDDLDAIYTLEAASYPPDEAATLEKLRYRVSTCPNLFLLAIRGETDALVGFVCGTATAEPKLTHESMSTHHPEGTLLCIHSVVVVPELRRTGIATKLLRMYLRYVQAGTPGIAEVRLLAKEQLTKLYEGVGFKLLGPSDVEHGADTWYELAFAFPSAQDDCQV